MATAIQARSLSTITAIADDPPDTVGQGCNDHPPLTLYIARVPGSQDVFLTTLKPREKVVSAQDVESSLYYCHLERVEDDEIRAALQDSDETQSLLDTKRRSLQLPPDRTPTVKRKALPKTPQLEGTQPDPPPKVYPHFQQPVSRPQGTMLVGRKPVNGSSIVSEPVRDSEISPGRKVLGPRPQVSPEHAPEFVGAAGKENIKPRPLPDLPPALPARTDSGLNVPYNGNITQAPVLPPRRMNSGKHFSGSRLHLEEQESSYRNTSTSLTASASKGFSITIIRRDPTSGGQWNVARVAKREEASNIYTTPKDTTGGVSLDVYTSGYDKFVGHKNRSSEENTSGYEPFQRTLQTKKPKLPNSASRKSMLRSSMDVSRNSSEQIQHDLLHPSTLISGDALPDLCFYSPWNGICEFSSGASGRTLKCRHSPPTIGNEVDQTLRRLNSSAISELRLNLPVVGSSTAKRPPLSASHSRSSFFSSRPRHKHSISADSTDDFTYNEKDEWDDAEEERMDLSLGQERAGGGFGGKKAKLGKLIVEGEGLLMLDLVVAANMGFWWDIKSQGR